MRGVRVRVRGRVRVERCARMPSPNITDLGLRLRLRSELGLRDARVYQVQI